MSAPDAIVIGLGVMGQAACDALTRAGARVLGLERFEAGHGLGSSHGCSRIVRRAYLEQPGFIPLLHEAYRGWADLEARSGVELVRRTGMLVASTTGSRRTGEEATRVAADAGVEVTAFERPPAAALGAMQLPVNAGGYLESDAGYVDPEATVRAFGWLARQGGADLRFAETVTGLHWNGDGVRVVTNRGEHRAPRAVVTAGPWTEELLGDLGMCLDVRRIPQLWFHAPPAYSEAAAMPCFQVDLDYGSFYGVPASDDGGTMKVCGGADRDRVPEPSALDRAIRDSDIAPVRRFIAECLPGVAVTPVAASVGMCTMTPDESFVVDRHPHAPSVIIAAGFSGHGFKFAPAIGEQIAVLARDLDAVTDPQLALRSSVRASVRPGAASLISSAPRPFVGSPARPSAPHPRYPS
jgi:monomeric sarcosine oxidase